MEEQKKNAAEVPQTQLLRFVLGTHNRGSAEVEASQALQEVVAGIRDTRKKGKVVLEIALEPIKGDVNRLAIEVKVTAKVPKQAPESDVFYSTEDGRLQKTDPNQLTWDKAEAFNREAGKLGAPVAAQVKAG